MQAVAIIKQLHVVEDCGAGLVSIFVQRVVHQFVLQIAEEALRDGVIQTIALAAHALHEN